MIFCLSFILLSLFFSSLIFVIYIFAYGRGQQRGLDEFNQWVMTEFWEEQNDRREARMPYYDENMEFIDPNE